MAWTKDIWLLATKISTMKQPVRKRAFFSGIEAAEVLCLVDGRVLKWAVLLYRWAS